jgi:hypothetical protein
MPESSNITSVFGGKSERLVFYTITTITERGEAEGGKGRQGRGKAGGRGGLGWEGSIPIVARLDMLASSSSSHPGPDLPSRALSSRHYRRCRRAQLGWRGGGFLPRLASGGGGGIRSCRPCQ